MPSAPSAEFDALYQSHLKHLKLKGLQPKTIDAYARAIRRAGDYFDHRIEALTEAQLADYFSQLLVSHSWSAVKRVGRNAIAVPPSGLRIAPQLC